MSKAQLHSQYTFVWTVNPLQAWTAGEAIANAIGVLERVGELEVIDIAKVSRPFTSGFHLSAKEKMEEASE